MSFHSLAEVVRVDECGAVSIRVPVTALQVLATLVADRGGRRGGASVPVTKCTPRGVFPLCDMDMSLAVAFVLATADLPTLHDAETAATATVRKTPFISQVLMSAGATRRVVCKGSVLSKLFGEQDSGSCVSVGEIGSVGEYLRVLLTVERHNGLLVRMLRAAHSVQNRCSFDEFEAKATQPRLARLFAVDRLAQCKRASPAKLHKKHVLAASSTVSELPRASRNETNGLWKVDSLLLLCFTVVMRDLLRSRYAPLETLRASIFGEILLCVDAQTQEEVVVKTVDLTLAAKRQSRASAHVQEDARAEVDALTRLRALGGHSNVIALRDCFVSADSRLLCVVLEYCDGGDLLDACVQQQDAAAGAAQSRRIDEYQALGMEDSGFRFVAKHGVKAVLKAWGLAGELSDPSQDLLERMLHVDVARRISLPELLRHPAVTGFPTSPVSVTAPL
ncbi:hypothetical protein PybrP1_001507 [[Pythium] brassicae (nom. inval.)]|nr:hypothetical protein PybrP1_001507 [[Pythium] brassicae (nom. inval.)]